MSKRSQPVQNSKRQSLYFAVSIIMLVVVGLGVLASRGTVKAAEPFSPSEYQTRFVSGGISHILLDVRTPEEFASGHIHGAVNIPVESLGNHLSEIPGGQPIVVYCHSGNRSAKAAQILAQAGYTSLYDLGGLNHWIAQGLPVE